MANYQFERDEAEFVAATSRRSPTSTIELTMPLASDNGTRSEGDERDAKLDAEGISVESFNGTVKLTGSVNSLGEHDARAERRARRASRRSTTRSACVLVSQESPEFMGSQRKTSRSTQA
jgi:hypothetical protein